MSSETALSIPKRRGNPNWVKGMSGNPSGKRKPWSDYRTRIAKLELKARRRMARLIDSENEHIALEACLAVYAYVLGKPMDGSTLAQMDAMLQKRLGNLKAAESLIEALTEPVLPKPEPVTEPAPTAGSLVPEAADVVPVQDAPAVSVPPVSSVTGAARCLYRLSSGPCETQPLDGEQWCAAHKAKLFGMLTAK